MICFVNFSLDYRDLMRGFYCAPPRKTLFIEIMLSFVFSFSINLFFLISFLISIFFPIQLSHFYDMTLQPDPHPRLLSLILQLEPTFLSLTLQPDPLKLELCKFNIIINIKNIIIFIIINIANKQFVKAQLCVYPYLLGLPKQHNLILFGPGPNNMAPTSSRLSPNNAH